MFQIHQFLNVGVQVECKFATILQIGVLVVVEFDDGLSVYVDFVENLEQNFLDEKDEVLEMVLNDENLIDWTDELEPIQVLVAVAADTDEVVDDEVVEDTETVEIDEDDDLVDAKQTLDDDETVEILDCIENDELDDFLELHTLLEQGDNDETVETDIIDDIDDEVEVVDVLETDDVELLKVDTDEMQDIEMHTPDLVEMQLQMYIDFIWMRDVFTIIV